MAQHEPSGSSKTIVFVSDGIGLRWGLWTIAVAISALAVIIRKTIDPSADQARTFAILILLGCIVVLGVVRRWTVRIDPHDRRMTIVRSLALRWTGVVLRTEVIEHCSFDECSEVGILTYTDTVGQWSWSRTDVIVDFKRGGRHRIPVQSWSLDEASRLAAELSAATGIPLQSRVGQAPAAERWSASS
ncbi:hypothetical protein ACE103_33305 [Bradyrhizobium sp. ma5]|uniref:hypothetical protein n=1 Tax=Bradyrhizobium sp. ma5 TaxID=3344828 RepID=UPI0035D4E39D